MPGLLPASNFVNRYQPGFASTGISADAGDTVQIIATPPDDTPTRSNLFGYDLF
jgi:hypothetical protein